jgi:hypothetical protein
MKTYYSHTAKAKASDYNPIVGIEYLKQGDLRCQGGMILFFGFDSR